MTVTGTNLSMVRGDTEAISVTPSVPFESGDSVIFTVRKQPLSPILLQKTVTLFNEGSAVISINPADTSSMNFGDYVYDIQVNWANGDVKTLIKKSVFKLEEEVTY